MVAKKRYKVIIGYNGNRYYGWAKQPNLLTIQQTVEDAFYNVFKQKIKIFCAGRTDKKVNALGQVFHFDWLTKTKIKSLAIIKAINHVLPPDIHLIKIFAVANNFHARFDAKWRIYQYFINTNPYYDPTSFSTVYQYNKPLDIKKIKQLKKMFIGRKNFLSFSIDHRKQRKDLIKTIKSINITENNAIVKIEIKGNHFLWSMVRMIVGCFIAFNENKITKKEIRDCFTHPKKGKSRFRAPANGLTLFKVIY